MQSSGQERCAAQCEISTQLHSKCIWSPAVATPCFDAQLSTPPFLTFVYQKECALASTMFPFTCSVCGPTHTTQKRYGPDGPGTLCNKYAGKQAPLGLLPHPRRCGLQHIRTLRQQERNKARERDAKKRVLQRMSVASLLDGVTESRAQLERPHGAGGRVQRLRRPAFTLVQGEAGL